MKPTRLSQAYISMIIAQTPRIGDSHFQDVVDMCCMGRL